MTPDELILYMPDYPVGHDEPINFTPGIMQWYMDGGTVQAHIPLVSPGFRAAHLALPSRDSEAPISSSR